MAHDTLLDELLAAVYASPHDDQLRLVLADALQAAGDPRGEFITLQLCRRDPARERELIDAYARTWLGNLADIVMPGLRRFQRGFLVSCAVGRLRPQQAEQSATYPEWASLERIQFDGWSNAEHYATVISGHMRSIRSLINVCDPGLEKLCQHHPDLPVEELGVASTRYMDYVPKRPVATLAACEGLERLRTLHLEFADFRLWSSVLDPLWDSPVGQRLDTLVIPHAKTEGWLDLQLPVRRLAVSTIDGWRMLERAAQRSYCRVKGPMLPLYWLQTVYERGYVHAIVEMTGEAISQAQAHDYVHRVGGPPVPTLEVRAVAADDPLPWEVSPGDEVSGHASRQAESSA